MESSPPITSEPGQAARPAQGSWSSVKDLLKTRRVMIFGAVLVAELAIFFIGTAVPIPPPEQTLLSNQEQTLLQQTSNIGPLGTVFAIFANNFRVALLEMIPLLGIFAFFASIFVTGQVFEVIAIGRNLPGPLLGSALFVFPFAIVELSCYAMAVASGTLLVISLPTGRFRRELKVFAVQIAAVAGLLFLAATMETITIYVPLIGLAFWIPLALLAYSLVQWVRQGPA